MPTNVQIERMNPNAISVQRTRRTLNIRGLTSIPAGVMCPVACFGLLREDALQATRLSLGFEMMETAELLVNPVNVRVMAYLVPHLALDRFLGMDDLNRSFMKQPSRPGGPTVPFIETQQYNAGLTGPDVGKMNSVYKYLGLHGQDTALVNTAILEAYNQIWNFRAKNRSPDLTLRNRLDTHLAPAFWYHEQFAMIVPDFQQAIIDGEVPLNVVASQLAVKGTAPITGDAATNITVRRGGTTAQLMQPQAGTVSGVSGSSLTDPGINAYLKWSSAAGGVGAIPGMKLDLSTATSALFAELQENGITVSLSNIELAKKTQTFALIRQQYNQLPEEWIIDLLMNGVQIPDQALMQPILLGQQNTIFGMSKRYAADGDNLTKSVVNGLTEVEMTITTPKINSGGVVMVVVEITPEQLWERQADPYFFTSDQEQWPEYLRDTLDPEKVEIVKNASIDVSHATPEGVFGYAPLNWRWAQQAPHVGGKFMKRDASTTFDEVRQRIWAVETVNPTLSESFYICTNIHTKPFVDTTADPFEVTVRGEAPITGNTVFGPLLIEGDGDYEAILAEAPQDRIDKPAALSQPAQQVTDASK